MLLYVFVMAALFTALWVVASVIVWFESRAVQRERILQNLARP